MFLLHKSYQILTKLAIILEILDLDLLFNFMALKKIDIKKFQRKMLKNSKKFHLKSKMEQI